MNKYKYVEEIPILDNQNKNLFDTENDYIIPLYQRAYAWEDKQLIQLIDDIWDVPDVPNDANYYLGSLIVSKQGNKYEVVDGQQRLTSLYLLLNCLGQTVKPTLKFACREKSNYTLNNISKLIKGERNELDAEQIEQGIQNGIKILQEKIPKDDNGNKSFIEKLKRVIIYRIEVPEHTDLNRYFEIMNTRGEQLEQHDILKANLMEPLLPDEQSTFAKIWDACSDMTGYVQMHFDKDVREQIFGSEWGKLPFEDWGKYKNAIDKNSGKEDKKTISEIIEPSYNESENDEDYNDDTRVRFESIIDFPYFLIHTLKVFIATEGIRHEDGKSKIIAELLDDKKLINTFEEVINHGYISSQRIDKTEFSRKFIICLLRTRYLFDKYIIKREYANENSDGEWSLKSLHVSNEKPYYKNSEFIQKGQHKKTNNERTKTNIMIQSALRVSYTSPKVMHWITKLLIWLSENDCERVCNNMVNYSKKAERIAKKAVKKNFFKKCKKNKYAMGVDTPHIVFNYLDFLIWKQNPNIYKDFVFEFRNSVEHWYPQNPSEDTFEKWKDVDRFGNLCIIQRNVNSKFSNLAPEAKKSTFEDMISKGSLKLREMSDLTKQTKSWKETTCEKHEEKMIMLLKEGCGLIKTE